MNEEFRRDLMDKIIKVAICRATEAGYAITVHNGKESVLLGEPDSRMVFEKLRSTDRDVLMCERLNKVVGWFMFSYVVANPWEVLADHTTNLADMLEPAQKLAGELADSYRQGAFV